MDAGLALAEGLVNAGFGVRSRWNLADLGTTEVYLSGSDIRSHDQSAVLDLDRQLAIARHEAEVALRVGS